jgi:hypothetical protein
MFSLKRKNKEKTFILTITDKNTTLYNGPINELPILNSQVIAGSIEFYDDPEPCMIHRSAVISRYYIQIEAWLEDINYQSNSTLDIENIPQDIIKLIDFNKGKVNEN